MGQQDLHRWGRLTGVGFVAAAVVWTAVVVVPPAAASTGQVLGTDRAGAVKDSYLVAIKDSAAPGRPRPAPPPSSPPPTAATSG